MVRDSLYQLLHGCKKGKKILILKIQVNLINVKQDRSGNPSKKALEITCKNMHKRWLANKLPLFIYYIDM
jgi:hypothetical protein